MAASLAPQLEPVTHTLPGAVRRRRDRAQHRAAAATRRIASRRLAKHLGVSPSRARHLRTDDQKGPLTTLLAMIADPAIEAAPLVVAVIEAFEERLTFAPTADLRARYRHLREVVEHGAQAKQDRALMVKASDRADACREHAAVLLELAMLDELLGIEERAH